MEQTLVDTWVCATRVSMGGGHCQLHKARGGRGILINSDTRASPHSVRQYVLNGQLKPSY